MYENRERFSIKDAILQIVLTVLFIFLLLWLFPTKSYVDKKIGSIDSALKPLYNQIFSQNVASMKEAAISYYTTERLPKNVGDKDKMTLGEMLDKKLLISFLDSNNKQCSLADSYVEITKMDSEYILKVNLSCSDNSDYILVHLGCYSYCPNGLCEKKEATVATKTSVVKQISNKNYEYEYEKVTNGKWGDWSDWSDWSTAKAVNTDYRNVRTKEDTIIVDTETIKVGTTTKVTEAISNTTYTCPNGYTKDGNKCTRVVTSTDTNDATISCPSGYALSGTTCVKNVSSSSVDTKNATANTTYSCPSGYALNGTTCVKNITTSSVDTKNATANTTYSCPSGYALSGTKCTKTDSVVSYYKKGSYVKTVYNASYVPKDTNSYFYDMTGSDYVYDCSKSCAMKWVYTYKVYKAEPVYTTTTDTKNATANTTYSCPSGYALSGTKCNKNIVNTSVDTKNATANTTYSCPSGYSLSGTKCNKSIVNTSVDTKAASISCESGYTLNGTKCSKQVTSNQVINASVNTTYSCKVGELVGKSCVVYEDKYETFNKYTTITYYSYREREYISGDRKVIWSSSQSDKNLINQGYVLTGKSREI